MITYQFENLNFASTLNSFCFLDIGGCLIFENPTFKWLRLIDSSACTNWATVFCLNLASWHSSSYLTSSGISGKDFSFDFCYCWKMKITLEILSIWKILVLSIFSRFSCRRVINFAWRRIRPFLILSFLRFWNVFNSSFLVANFSRRNCCLKALKTNCFTVCIERSWDILVNTRFSTFPLSFILIVENACLNCFFCKCENK